MSRREKGAGAGNSGMISRVNTVSILTTRYLHKLPVTLIFLTVTGNVTVTLVTMTEIAEEHAYMHLSFVARQFIVRGL
jgi:hypothetical protein